MKFRRTHVEPEVRRPVLDPDSQALIYVTSAEGADAATVDRMLASARAELDALEGRLAQHRDEIG